MSDIVLPEQIQTDWIENLALDELNMDEAGIVHFDDHLNIDRILEESSLDLMNKIRDLVEVYTIRFNQYRGEKAQGSQIKIFKISNTINDFMLFRNSLKLVFARKSGDVISVGFVSNTGGLYAARLNRSEPALNKAHEIRAGVGPFNKVTWRFQGELLDTPAMVRHYMTEFIKNSAR
ncbi:MAG: hypothetical protein OXB88_00705 [Bacteriovoracales bacterium]|nr:hypothetical protein [Bacteriovoracales bacterium]